MRANEFVKKFGWGWAKDVVNNQPKTDAQIFNPYNQKYSSSYNIKKGVSVAWLKHFVESHEIVEYIGNDLDGAKQVYAFTKDCVHIAMRDRMIPVIRLKQAIADVESCQ